MTSLTITNESVILGERARNQARDVVTQIRDENVLGVSISLDGHTFQVGPEVADLILHVISQSARGSRIAITSMPEELTTTAASRILGISRPTLMKLINQNEISSFKVGSHTRIAMKELDRYRAERLAAKRQLLLEMDALSQEIGE